MKKSIFIIMIITLVFGLSTPFVDALRSNGVSYNATIIPVNEKYLQYEVQGFYPTSMASIDEYKTLNYSLLSTIVYCGVKVRSDGSIYGITNYTVGGTSPAIIQYAHNRNVKVVLMFQQENVTSVDYILANQNGEQSTLIRNLLSEVYSKGYDGIDDDFESVRVNNSLTGMPNKPLMSNFIANLSQAFLNNNSNYRLLLDIYGNYLSNENGTDAIFDLNKVQNNFSYIMAMEYDWSGNWSKNSTSNSPIDQIWPTNVYNDNKSLRHYITEMDGRKLLFGIPWYGVDFPTKDNTSYSAKNGTAIQINYEDVIKKDYGNNSVVYNASWKTPWRAYWSNITGWHEVQYDDNVSIKTKYNLMKELSLGGTGMWALTSATNLTDLWDPIEDNLLTVTYNITAYNPYNITAVKFNETYNNASGNKTGLQMNYSFGNLISGTYNINIYYNNVTVYQNRTVYVDSNGYLNYSVTGGFDGNNSSRNQVITGVHNSYGMCTNSNCHPYTGTIRGTIMDKDWNGSLSIIGSATETLERWGQRVI